jgi:leader peptidase (prepilin peptidase)/N-methyltransferase
MEIPDEVSLPGAAIGLATVGWRSAPGAEDAALGAGLGFLVVQLVFVWAYERLAGRRGMGEGDSKLLMMIGAFVGWQGALFALVAGAMQGLVAAGVVLASGKSPTPVRPDEAGAPPAPEPERAAAPAASDGAEADAAAPAEGTPSAPGEPPSEPKAAEPARDAGAPVAGVKVPYGPFLALGALEWLFFGDAIADAYLDWMAG